jgi:hypothetical protein
MALLMAAITQTDLQAQSAATIRYYPGYGLRARYVPAPIYYHSGGTVAGSYMRGAASMIYAQGAYNRLTAEARAISAEAQSREIENRQQAASTYFAMREANRQARAEERGPRASAEDLARFAREARPDRLAANELDPDSGRISWPALLQDDRFSALRHELEYAFTQRAISGAIGAQQQARVRQVAAGMLDELRGYVRQVGPMEYTTARAFIESLAYEAQLPVG